MDCIDFKNFSSTHINSYGQYFTHYTKLNTITDDVKELICKLVAPVDNFTQNTFYISAKTGENVKDMFATISSDVLEKLQSKIYVKKVENAPLLHCWETDSSDAKSRTEWGCWPCVIM